MSPGSLSFAKLVMMSSAPAKPVGDARYASQEPIIQRCPIQSRLQSVLRVRSYYVERNKANQSQRSEFLFHPIN